MGSGRAEPMQERRHCIGPLALAWGLGRANDKGKEERIAAAMMADLILSIGMA